jgi:hypothetical protein
MADGPTMDNAIDAVAAQLAMANVVCRLAIDADQGGLDGYINAFDEDATVVLPIGTLRGRAEIRAMAESRRASGAGGPGSNSRHVVTTMSTDMSGPDVGEAISYFSYFESTATAPVIVSAGTYGDLFRRTGGIWRIARRIVTVG